MGVVELKIIIIKYSLEGFYKGLTEMMKDR